MKDYDFVNMFWVSVALIAVALTYWSLDCSIPIDPQVTVKQVNVELCLALVQTVDGVKEELVYCDAGASVPLDAGL